MVLRLDKFKLSLFALLLVVFIDYLGIGLVYPLFSYLMLHPEAEFLPPETSQALRGSFLGILIALYSIGQFLSGSILGKLSDRFGRKKVLIGSHAICVFGYIISIFGIEYKTLFLLLLSRLVIGLGSAVRR